MNRWLIAPVLCALTVPSAAWAQPTSPPAATEPAPEAVAAPEATQAQPAATQPAQPSTQEAGADAPAPEVAAPPPPLVASDPVPAPASPAAVAPPPPKPTGPVLNKHAEPLLAAGLGGFAGLYLLTAYAGAATIDKARDIRKRDDGPGGDNGNMTLNRGRALLIPGVGPFIATRFTNSARRQYWQVVNGSLQIGTMAMAIIGSRMYTKHRRAKRRAQFAAAASPEGAQVGMSMQF